MAKLNRVRFYFMLIAFCNFSFKGHICFFIKHSSGRCVRTAASAYLSNAWMKIWYLELTNQCTHPSSQFRFLHNGVLNHISSTGCVVPFDGKSVPKDGINLVVLDGQNDCTNKSRQAYTQTDLGSLRHVSGKCVQAHTSFQAIPSVGAKLEYTSTCNTTKQQFTLGSVTCEGLGTVDINCPSSQVIVITTANYGGLGRLNTCGYNSNYNCLLPSTLCLVKRKCDGQETCKINVKTSEFKHDPCPSMAKYLYLEYKCVKKTEFRKGNAHFKSARIASQTNPGEGYVEVLQDSKPETWQRLCVENWKDTEQQVICRGLGYSEAKQLPSSVISAQGDSKKEYQAVYGDLYCNSKSQNVSSCCFKKTSDSKSTCSMARVACMICSEPIFGRNNEHGFSFVASNYIPGHTADQATVSSSRSWCGIGTGDYLQIDLGRKFVINQLAILGDSSRGQWVTSYEIFFAEEKEIWLQGIVGGQKRSKQSTEEVQLLVGSLDGSVKVSRAVLDSSITARFLKILPKAWHGLPCMKLEICGHRLLADAPANVTLSTLTPYTADVSWSKPWETGDGPLTDYVMRLLREGNTESRVVSKAEYWRLRNLKPYTRYTVYIQAGNKHGYGSRAETKFRTNSTAPGGPPTDIKIVAESSTSLTISWNEPLTHLRNGVLDGYKVCIAHALSKEECDHTILTGSSRVRVSNLGAAMKYEVKIAARNDAGFGNYSGFHFKITNAEAPACNISTITKKSFVIKLQRPRKEVRFCRVITMSLPLDSGPPKTLVYSTEPATYLEASGSATSIPYVAAEFFASDFNSYEDFTVGDGMIFTALAEIPRNNTGAVKKYFNGPLSSSVRYTVFQRFYSAKELLYSSDFLPPVKTLGKTSTERLTADSRNAGDNFKVPFIIVTVLLGLIVFAIFCVLLLQRQRGRNKDSVRKDKQTTADEKIPMNKIKNNNNQQTSEPV